MIGFAPFLGTEPSRRNRANLRKANMLKSLLIAASEVENNRTISFYEVDVNLLDRIYGGLRPDCECFESSCIGTGTSVQMDCVSC